METRAVNLARHNVPWRRDLPWSVLAGEGAVVLAIGLYLVIDPGSAQDITRQLIAAMLFGHSALQVVGAFRVPPNPLMRFHLVRAGVGLTVGAIVTLAPFNDELTDAAARWILGFGLLGYGLIALAAIVALRAEQGLRVGALVTAGVTVVVALLLMTGSETSTSRTSILGSLALLVGVLLLVYAAYLRRAVATAAPPQPPPAAPTAPDG